MNLRQYREYKGLSQAQLAEELKPITTGLDVPMISKIEKGICEPPEKVWAYINRNEDKLTQKEQVLKYIMDFGCITSWDAYRDLGVTQLATRIFELKQRGYQFDKKQVCGKNRYGRDVTWVEYKLKEQ